MIEYTITEEMAGTIVAVYSGSQVRLRLRGVLQCIVGSNAD